MYNCVYCFRRYLWRFYFRSRLYLHDSSVLLFCGRDKFETGLLRHALAWISDLIVLSALHVLYYLQVSVADLPGLIEGASVNRGLGHRFLKHTQKARALALVVCSSFSLSVKFLSFQRWGRHFIESFSMLPILSGTVFRNRLILYLVDSSD